MKSEAQIALLRFGANWASQPTIFSEITGARACTASRSRMYYPARSPLSGWLVGVVAIPPLCGFVHERGRVLLHVSACARCASASTQVAAATAIEGQMKTRFRGSRVDRHGLSVCMSHAPSHERRSQSVRDKSVHSREIWRIRGLFLRTSPPEFRWLHSKKGRVVSLALFSLANI